MMDYESEQGLDRQVNIGISLYARRLAKDYISELMKELKSKDESGHQGSGAKCLVEFHNCTPYIIKLFWIDFEGCPKKYSTLEPGAFFAADTFVNHLWLFRATVSGVEDHIVRMNEAKKIVALTEEQVATGQLEFTKTNPQTLPQATQIERYICQLCKFLGHVQDTEPTHPCPHLTGATMLLTPNHSTFHSKYSYICDLDDHQQSHTTKRRKIFLLEPFYSLKERCFLVLNNHFGARKIMSMDFLVHVMKDFLDFTITVK